MKISTHRALAPAKAKAGQRMPTGSARFSLDNVDTVATPTATVEAQAIGGVGALLALQEVPGPQTGSRQKRLKRADQMMQLLEELRLGLLMGKLDDEVQARLRGLLTEAQERTDDIEPDLQDLLREIETRAAVELEKLAQSRKR